MLTAFPQLLSHPALRRQLLRRVMLWTLVVAAFLGLGAGFAHRESRAIALGQARDGFQKDVITRLWASQRGGVYVPLDGRTPANPYLAHIPDREITTTTGKVYTLVNPAYMLRMMHELGREEFGLQGHITSLKPLRPDNAPDPWEREALKRFETGTAEYWEEVKVDGRAHLRYMKSLIASEGCLRCHAAQGYQVGDIRGGVSLTVPLRLGSNLIGGIPNPTAMLIIGLLWLLGLGAILVIGRGELVRRLERERGVQVLQLSEQKFRTLFETLTEGIALHEVVQNAAGQPVDYRVLEVNPAFETHTGLSSAAVKGRLAREAYEAAEPPYFQEYLRVAWGGEPLTFETYFPPLDKHFRISAVSPRHGQFATVFEDITRRKRQEVELKQKNAEMERFTYMVSHDLKSPLVTIRTFLGYLEQDLEQGSPERVAKDMGYIRDATGKMARLLEDLLEVSRVGRVVKPPVEISLAKLIQEAQAAVAGAITSRRVSIRVEAPPMTLWGDRTRLEEIWQNLLENAVKYLGNQASPEVILGVEGTGPDAVFFVKDNGMGIDPRFQDKVFGLFEQLDAASEGTGLGLALVKRIVELHEGRIWLESEGVGRGTCFRFTLPLALNPRTPGSGS